MNTWYHFAAVYDAVAQTGTTYRNGSFMGTTAYTHGSRTTTTVPLKIGRATSSGSGLSTDNWNGRLDSIYLFKGYCLTASNVTALYNAGAGVDYPSF